MIPARHHLLAIWFFDLYFRLKMKMHFRGISIEGDEPDPEKPALLLQNHFSWWDGYWSYYLSQHFFKKKFHVMMLEKQLRKRMFINRCGAFSVRPESHDVLQSVQYAARLLDDPQNLVCLYPQGEIQSQHVHPVRFKKGAFRIINQANTPVQVYFCVALVDYFSHSKPIVRFYLRHFEGETSATELETAYRIFQEQCINKQHE